MDTEQIDAQFNRAVEIVQILSKPGYPKIGCEGKRAILYEQATIDRSNWLMLGRWDRLKRCEDRLCWDCTLPELQKYTSVGKREARWIYIEELKNTLYSYPNRSVAGFLIDDLERAGGPNDRAVSSNLGGATALRDRENDDSSNEPLDEPSDESSDGSSETLSSSSSSSSSAKPAGAQKHPGARGVAPIDPEHSGASGALWNEVPAPEHALRGIGLALEHSGAPQSAQDRLERLESPPAIRSTSEPMSSSGDSSPQRHVSDMPLNSLMSTTQVITHLGNHGCENITDRLDLSSCSVYPISSGGFGDVYRGKLLGSSQVAIKTMRILVNTDEAQKTLKNAARELHTWSKCQHPNVVPLLGLVEFRDQIGMVSYWMENGSLPSYLERHSEVDRCQLSTGICNGLSYLHATNIVHGDLKGLNVLISETGRPMLTDFGNAILQESTLRFTATITKTNLSPRWAAPELMEQLGMHSFAADVYALGMTILETITGKVPYFYKPDIGIPYVVVVKKEFPLRPEDSIPSGSIDGNTLWSLLTSCWVYEPKERPSADHVQNIMKTITTGGLTITRAEETDTQVTA